MFKKFITVVTAAAMVLTLSACTGSDTETTEKETTAATTEAVETVAEDSDDGKIVITDQLGKEIEFDAPPERLATTIMPFPYIFHAVMGDNDHMVGCNPSSMVAYEDSALRHMYTKMADADTSWVDSSFVVNVEELLKLKPDVVFQWDYMTEEIDKMEAAGLKVVALHYGTLDDLEYWINLIATLYQKEERGQEIIDYFHEQVAEVDERISTLDSKELPNIIQLTDDMQVAGVGFNNYWMEEAGAVNPAKELDGEERTVDMEQMMLWNPSFIFIGNFTDLQPSDILENKIDGEDWSMIDAVKEGNVYKIPIGGYRWDPPGVETPLMVKWIAKTIHPDLFEDMDMKEEVSEFYQKVYNFTLTDEMLSEILDDTQN